MRFLLVCFALACVACGGSPVASTEDAGSNPVDGGATPDTGVPNDAAMSGCADDQHDCDGVCTDDGDNDPATGCRLGCGEACPGGTMAICNADGTCGTRVCEADTCESLGLACGPADDGCGNPLVCGSCDPGLSCQAGACVCEPDAGEPDNDSRSTAVFTRSIDDSVEPPPFATRGTLHESGDEDWYEVDIVDGSDGGSPVIVVELTDAPAGSNYEIAAYFGCADTSGTNTTSCTEGANDDSIEQGCNTATRSTDRIEMDTSCGGLLTDENGTLWIRVRATTWADTCDEYSFEVSVT